MATGEPLVGEREDRRSREAGAEGLLEVHLDELGLLLFAVSERVDAVLAEDEGLLVGLVLEALEVGPKLRPACAGRH